MSLDCDLDHAPTAKAETGVLRYAHPHRASTSAGKDGRILQPSAPDAEILGLFDSVSRVSPTGALARL